MQHVANNYPGKMLANGRHAWFDPNSGLIIIFNPNTQKEGTAFIAANGLHYFNNVLK